MVSLGFDRSIGIRGENMCVHNDDDTDCLNCCFENGREDAEDGEPCRPWYKNIDQCNAYRDGYGSTDTNGV